MENKDIKDEDYVYDSGIHPKKVKLKSNYRFYRTNIFFRIWNKIWLYIISFIALFPKKLVWGYKIYGKKNRKYAKGAIIIQNHIHQLDGGSILPTFRGKRVFITMLETNLGFGYISHVFRNCGCVPIPTEPGMFKKFSRKTIDVLNNGYNVIFYPEAMIYPYCDHIRKFKLGAFKFAYESNNKIIIPTVTTYHKPKGLYKLTRGKKPCFHYHILEPYYVKNLGNKRLSIEKACNDVHDIMTKFFIENSDYFN